MKLNKKRILGLAFPHAIEGKLSEISHLVFRLSFSFLMIQHGWAKLTQFYKIKHTFPDPLGLGSQLTLLLTISTEFFAALLLAFGLFTRISAFSLFITMMIIVFVFHADDPFNKKELALVYGAAFLVLALCGGKRWSIDHYLRSWIK